MIDLMKQLIQVLNSESHEEIVALLPTDNFIIIDIDEPKNSRLVSLEMACPYAEMLNVLNDCIYIECIDEETRVFLLDKLENPDVNFDYTETITESEKERILRMLKEV